MDNTENTQSGDTTSTNSKTDNKNAATGGANKNNASQAGKSGGASAATTGGGGNQTTTADSTASTGVVSDATSAVKDALGQAKEKGSAVASQAYGIAAQKATEAIDEHKASLTQGLTSVADTIRQVGDNLKGAQEPTGVANIAAQYTTTAAKKVEELSGYLDRRDFKGLVRDLENTAHRNPAIFLGGAFALGILAARFFKSGNPDNAVTRREQRRISGNSDDRSGGNFGGSGDIGGGMQVRQLRRKSTGGRTDMSNNTADNQTTPNRADNTTSLNTGDNKTGATSSSPNATSENRGG